MQCYLCGAPATAVLEVKGPAGESATPIGGVCSAHECRVVMLDKARRWGGELAQKVHAVNHSEEN